MTEIHAKRVSIIFLSIIYDKLQQQWLQKKSID